MFNKNDTVCILGASISTHGHYLKEIVEFMAKNHKEKRVKFFNCGAPGDAACRALYRLHEDCLMLTPQKVILMIGLNDIERVLYNKGAEIENLEEKKKYYIDLHKKSVLKLLEDCNAFGAEMILCSQTPVDDEVCGTVGCNDAVLECVKFLKDLAEERNLLFIDLHTPLYERMHDGIMENDGVHPNEKGHHIMAQVMLKAFGYIDECDFETMPEFSEKNLERYKVEQMYRDIRMIEWVFMYDFNRANPEASYIDKIAKAKEIRVQGVELDREWQVRAADNYINYFHRVPYLQGEIMRKTIAMYD